MKARECTNVGCPYCFKGVSMRGKRVGLCGMPEPFIVVGCPGQAMPTNR